MHLKFPPQLLLLFLATDSLSNSFMVYLYQGSHCDSAEDGVVQISLANDACNTTGVGVAESVLIVAEATDGPNDSVAFYSTGDCNPSNGIAEGQSGCLTISSAFNNYMSFNVISGQTEVGIKRSVDLGAELLDRTIADEIRYLGSIDPEWDGTEFDDSIVYHGKVEPYGDHIVKWHEEALGIFSGVPLEEWDDTFHIQNKTKVIFGLNYPIDFGSGNHLLRRESNLGDRDLKGICDAFQNCAEAVTLNVKGFTLNYVMPAGMNAWVALNGGSTAVWNYINMYPKAVKFAVALANNQIVNGVISAYMFTALTGGDHNSVVQCSSQGTEADTIVSMVTSTVTTTSTITSTQVILQTANGKDFYGAFQVTSGMCLTCYVGECAAPTTKNRRSLSRYRRLKRSLRL